MTSFVDQVPSRFDPMKRIICYDDFDRGFCGWTQLVGNYEHTLDAMLPSYAQHTQPMLSTVSHWDAGSHGGVDGSYVLKVQTRPKAGSRNVAVKRLTFRKAGPMRFEFYFTFKPEATELRLSETDVRSVGFLFDLQDGYEKNGRRVMPHLRFLNAEKGVHRQIWQYKEQTTPFKELGTEGKIVTHDHLAPRDWIDLPDGHQKLCYNEIPTKINWHYARLDFDLAAMRMVEFQCNDRIWDMSKTGVIVIPGMRNLWCMLNFCLFAEAEIDKRVMFYVDSVCVSGDF